MITVFTPTYNRAHLLPRLYDSLCKQTSFDFEWLVVDDGSTDNTQSLFNEWSYTKEFNIRYIKQNNGGKHRAINNGVNLANGQLFFIVDSDDWLSIDAIETIKSCEALLKNSGGRFAGICCLRNYPDGSIIGTTFRGDYVDALTYERGKIGITGDKSEIYYTEVLRRYPFPEIDGERFCPEALIWNRISEDGLKLRYFNKAIYYCDYQPDGLTSRIDVLLTTNFKAYSLYAEELVLSTQASSYEKKKTTINYVRRARINGVSPKEIMDTMHISCFQIVLYSMIAYIVYKLREVNKKQ